jgi:uncharacterized protein YndB with AHSA1/START domain
MYTIENTIEIAAPAHRIIEALTTEAGYRGWWTDEATYDGKAARFPFRNRDGARIVTFRVDQADARGVVMTCTAQEDNPDWLGTKLAISVEGGHVRLVHSGYPAKNETYERCVQGWAYFVTSLKSYVETGAGTPYKNAAC